MESHNPFEHMRALNDEQRELKRRRVPSPVLNCSINIDGTCGQSPCLEVTSSSGEVTHACLAHFVAQLDADDILLKSDVKLIDETGFHKQTAEVNSLWVEAVGSLLVQMYELQRKEEAANRNDPLAALSTNTSQKRKELHRVFGAPVAHLQGNADMARDATEHRKRSSATPRQAQAEAPPANLYKINPYVRRDTDRSGSLFAGLGSAAASVERMQREAKSDEDAAERSAAASAAAVRCSRCGSAWVSERQSEYVDGTRGEIWGSKDMLLVRYVACNKCGHVEAERE